MASSSSARRLKKLVKKASREHLITREEYDFILNLAMEDGIIDKKEQLFIDRLNDMVENKIIKIIP